VCLIGPSGSGKSTTAQLVAQILSPQKGQIYFFDNVKTAYVPQHSKLPNELTVFDYLLSCLVEISDHEKKETLIRTYLLLLNISSELHSPISNLSGGQRQRVIIAAALILNPNLIVLDEPFGHASRAARARQRGHAC
jgi:ABC-type multidrug transport system ATPase subunit